MAGGDPPLPGEPDEPAVAFVPPAPGIPPLGGDPPLDVEPASPALPLPPSPPLPPAGGSPLHSELGVRPHSVWASSQSRATVPACTSSQQCPSQSASTHCVSWPLSLRSS